MTDLDQRIAALREAVKTASTTVVIDGHVQYVSWAALAVIDEQAAEIERLRAENAELETECEEGDALRMKLSANLTGVANALRGQPPELTSWSWHDLPDRAAAAIAAIDVMTRAARENAVEAERLRARLAELERLSGFECGNG